MTISCRCTCPITWHRAAFITIIQLSAIMLNWPAADDLLSRIATIKSKHDGTTAKQLSEYSYFGTSRVASTKFGHNGTAPVMTLGVTDPMLDRFGMPRDLFYDVVQASQDLRFVASRDVMGSPTSVATTLRGASNTRSWTFAYDALNRLDVAASGQLSSGAISSPSLHGYDWSLDSRDNWAGDGSSPGLTVSANGSTVDQITHTVEKDSSITSVTSSGPGTVYYDLSQFPLTGFHPTLRSSNCTGLM